MNVLAALKDRFRPALAGLVADQAKVGRAAGDDPAGAGREVRRLSGQLRDAAGQAARQAAARDRRADHRAKPTLDDLCQPPEIAGPGFINLRLRTTGWPTQLNAAGARRAAGHSAGRSSRGRSSSTISSPNVAKPMHVGHIRSTVIGDALYRTLRFLGHRVDQRQPHRRLGHAVRDDHLWLQAFRRSRGLRSQPGRRAGPAV